MQHAPPGAQGTVSVGADSVDIGRVQSTDAADYTMTSSNSMGEGQFSFRLNVEGKDFVVVSLFSIALFVVLIGEVYILVLRIFLPLFFTSQLLMHTDSHALSISRTNTTIHSVKLKLLRLVLD